MEQYQRKNGVLTNTARAAVLGIAALANSGCGDQPMSTEASTRYQMASRADFHDAKEQKPCPAYSAFKDECWKTPGKARYGICLDDRLQTFSEAHGFLGIPKRALDLGLTAASEAWSGTSEYTPNDRVHVMVYIPYGKQKSGKTVHFNLDRDSYGVLHAVIETALVEQQRPLTVDEVYGICSKLESHERREQKRESFDLDKAIEDAVKKATREHDADKKAH